MTGRERERIAECQDRMLREADRVMFGDEEGPVCGNCRHYDHIGYRDSEGGRWRYRMGLCSECDLVCESDGPACEWWSA